MQPNLTPVTRNIILINVLLFIVTQFSFQSLQPILAGFYPFSPNFHSWQIITHMFMHGGWAHLIFNMLTFYSFGPVLERIIGEKKFIILYFVCGLGSFVLYNLWNFYNVYELTQDLIAQGVDISQIYTKASISYSGSYQMQLPIGADEQKVAELFGYYRTPMVGASGAIFGIVAGFATLFPNAEMMFMFIPFPIKAKFLVPIIITVSFFLGFKQVEGDNIAHFAHIGGALIGFVWMINWKKNRDRID